MAMLTITRFATASEIWRNVTCETCPCLGFVELSLKDGKGKIVLDIRVDV